MNTDIETDEKHLVLQLKQGNECAFQILYKKYKFSLAGNLFKLLKSEALVQETLQEIFYKIWKNREQIDLDKSFKAYLFRLGENLVIDHFRKAGKDKRLLAKIVAASSELYFHVEEYILYKEKSQIFKQAIDLMPPQRKQVFTLCKMEGKSYKEVEEIMGISSKTISSHMLKANMFLRNYFSPSVVAGAVFLLAFLLIGY